MADPMVYPLLFPYGEAGHDCAASHHFNPSKKVTFREFYRFRLQMRNQPVNPPNRNTYSESVPHGFSVLHNAGKLFQQYLVDAYVKIESNELWWYKSNMQQIRQSGYPNLLNYLERRARMESTTIPDVDSEPMLYGIVAENYLHRKCSGQEGSREAACIKNGRCSKGFPKSYRHDTILNYHLTSTKDGRPDYRRPHDGRQITDLGNAALYFITRHPLSKGRKIFTSITWSSIAANRLILVRTKPYRLDTP
ncbi:hypothetical protein HUJ04_012870 [Dendroctonus ponderosae]|nr:hypothetical protein HUJ04_012870 [Dendroctonus ponderosae]